MQTHFFSFPFWTISNSSVIILLGLLHPTGQNHCLIYSCGIYPVTVLCLLHQCKAAVNAQRMLRGLRPPFESVLQRENPPVLTLCHNNFFFFWGLSPGGFISMPWLETFTFLGESVLNVLNSGNLRLFLSLFQFLSLSISPIFLCVSKTV